MNKLKKYFLKITRLFIYFQTIKLEEQRIKEEQQLKNKYMYYYQLMQKWFNKIQYNLTPNDYFTSKKIKKIIIYGTGTLCDIFYKEIEKTGFIEINCMVDKSPISKFYKLNQDIPIISTKKLGDYIYKVDILIVTPVYEYNLIYEDIKKKYPKCNIISLETVINNYF